MKKYSKKQMTKFDYRIRFLIVFSVLIFALTAVIIHPQMTSNENKNVEIQEKIQEKQYDIDTAREKLEEILEKQTTELTD